MNKTVWIIIKEVVNALPVGNILDRDDIISTLEKSGYVNKNFWSAPKGTPKYSDKNIDNIQSLLTRSGYLARMSRNKHKVLRHLGSNTTRPKVVAECL